MDSYKFPLQESILAETNLGSKQNLILVYLVIIVL